ncbi:hypothetical protein VTJ04DRAFT_2029 [Mycothermus thermophilus]|uniref:uncharacterized protein n=1 Tax=Humicola insolens TaxID=85995 RepID=UPI003744055D
MLRRNRKRQFPQPPNVSSPSAITQMSNADLVTASTPRGDVLDPSSSHVLSARRVQTRSQTRALLALEAALKAAQTNGDDEIPDGNADVNADAAAGGSGSAVSRGVALSSLPRQRRGQRRGASWRAAAGALRGTNKARKNVSRGEKDQGSSSRTAGTTALELITTKLEHSCSPPIGDDVSRPRRSRPKAIEFFDVPDTPAAATAEGAQRTTPNRLETLPWSALLPPATSQIPWHIYGLEDAPPPPSGLCNGPEPGSRTSQTSDPEASPPRRNTADARGRVHHDTPPPSAFYPSEVDPYSFVLSQPSVPDQQQQQSKAPSPIPNPISPEQGTIFCQPCFLATLTRWTQLRDKLFHALELLGGDEAVRKGCALKREVEEAEREVRWGLFEKAVYSATAALDRRRSSDGDSDQGEQGEEEVVIGWGGTGRKRKRNTDMGGEDRGGGVGKGRKKVKVDKLGHPQGRGGKASQGTSGKPVAAKKAGKVRKGKGTTTVVLAKRLVVMADDSSTKEELHFTEYPPEVVGLVLLRIVYEESRAHLTSIQADEVDNVLEQLREDIHVQSWVVQGLIRVCKDGLHRWRASKSAPPSATSWTSLRTGTSTTSRGPPTPGLMTRLRQALGVTRSTSEFIRSVEDRIAEADRDLEAPAPLVKLTTPLTTEKGTPDHEKDPSRSEYALYFVLSAAPSLEVIASNDKRCKNGWQFQTGQDNHQGGEMERLTAKQAARIKSCHDWVSLIASRMSTREVCIREDGSDAARPFGAGPEGIAGLGCLLRFLVDKGNGKDGLRMVVLEMRGLFETVYSVGGDREKERGQVRYVPPPVVVKQRDGVVLGTARSPVGRWEGGEGGEFRGYRVI